MPVWLWSPRKNSTPHGYRKLTHYREKAGLDVRATPHTLRHSSASHMVAAGVPTVFVQQVLGHRYLSSTQVYCHLTKEQLLEAARALE